MDVLHRQVEEYESEMRFMKDTKSPSKARSRTPRRTFSQRDHSRSSESLQSLESEANTGAFEAALFRPALQAARRDAAKWKASATISTLLELPALNVPAYSNYNEEEKTADEDISPFMQLTSALANYRTQTASIKVVDLTKPKPGKTPRSELFSMVMKKASAANELDEATAVARQWMQSRQPAIIQPVRDVINAPLMGKVKFAGPEPVKTLSTSTNVEDLYRLQLHMVR